VRVISGGKCQSMIRASHWFEHPTGNFGPRWGKEWMVSTHGFPCGGCLVDAARVQQVTRLLVRGWQIDGLLFGG